MQSRLSLGKGAARVDGQPRSPDPGLINEDLRPTRPDERHWSVFNLASLWVGMVVCVPTYMLASGLISAGMNWVEAVSTILIGNAIVLVPMILNGHPGTKYGVPFPVLARSAFGISGAHLPSLLRALVGCGWFGIQTWVGGSAVYQMINVVTDKALLAPPIEGLGINLGELLCFLGFWLLQIVILYRGIESIRVLETWAAPFLIIMGLALLGWAWSRAGGFGNMLDTPSQFAEGQPKAGQFWKVFFPSLTAMVGFWATLSLNIPDFTRYAKSQKDQVLGQALGLPPTMALFAFIGVAVTSATPVIFGETIWDPTVLLGKMDSALAVGLSLLALTVATLSTNIAANVVSPANALINLAPRRIGFRRGAFITALVGIAMMPWKLMADPSGYIFTWLQGYSALLGPIGGILVADYYLVRKRRLDLDALYQPAGPYGGVNWAGVVALVVAVLPNLPGFLAQLGVVTEFPALDVFREIYVYAWFVGFLLAGVLYVALMPLTGAARRAPGPEEAT